MRLLALAVLALAAPAQALAQQWRNDPNARPAGAATVFAFNALIGGTTAAIHAWIADKDPAKAFALGTLGGAVHFGGKLMAVRSSAGMIPVAVSSVGSSMVTNAARDKWLLSEVVIPVGFLRLSIRPRDERKTALAVNALEVVLLGYMFSRSGLVLDSERSLAAGTFVFETRRRQPVVGGKVVAGVAIGPLIVLSKYARDQNLTNRHEIAHVHQYWFMQTTIDAPLENWMRESVPFGRRLPAWLELGVVLPYVLTVDGILFGQQSPIDAAREREAEILSR